MYPLPPLKDGGHKTGQRLLDIQAIKNNMNKFITV